MSGDVIRPPPSPRPEVPAGVQGIVRVAVLLGAPALLREHAVDPAGLLASVGLDPGTFDDPDNRIPYSTAGRFIERCVEATGCRHFGLLVGQRATISSLGPLGELMRCSPTVAAALRSLMLHLHLQTRGGVPTLGVEDQTASFGYAIYQRDMPGAAQGYDLVMAFECNILRALCGAHWRPSEVSFSHARPKDIGPYQQCFRSALRFDAERTAMMFPKTWLDRALPGSDPVLHRAAPVRDRGPGAVDA